MGFSAAILLMILGIPGLLSGVNSNTDPDPISKKIYRETIDVNDQYVSMMLHFPNASGRRLLDVVSPDSIEKIYIRYHTKITPEQVSYLFHHAVFKSYKDLPAAHLAPAGAFTVLLGNLVPLTFTMYAGVPVIRVTSDSDEYWLEIPDYRMFQSLGRKEPGAISGPSQPIFVAGKPDSTPSKTDPDRELPELATQAYVGAQKFAPQRDEEWVEQCLNLGLDMKKLGCRIVAYRIQWFNGQWSNWFVPGVNDLYKKSSETLRRYWACFNDHHFEIIYTAEKKLDFSKTAAGKRVDEIKK